MTETELRQQVVRQAESWLGCREADGSHRAIIDVYNSIDPLPRGYRMSDSDPWCAAFVSAVAQACGLTGILFPECGCEPMIERYRAAGRWMEDDAYVPRAGDLLFYDWQDDGRGDDLGCADHVGLVAGVDGGRITVIEGNCADSVCCQYRQVDGRTIRGYGLPDYAGAAEDSEEDPSPPSDGFTRNDKEKPEREEGWCAVTLPALGLGDEGEAVRAAQLLLKGRGFSVGWMGADGAFGPRTESAVSSYQRACGIEKTGVIGPETWAALIRGRGR